MTQPLTKGWCPRCGPDRLAEVMSEHFAVVRTSDLEMVYGRQHYQVLECAGCKTTYVKLRQQLFDDSETLYWPLPLKRQRPDWMINLLTKDRCLYDLLEAVYKAFDNDLNVLSAIGIRTAFDRASELLGIDPDKTFAQKLQAMQDAGHIGTVEKEVLSVLVDAGGAAAHRGWAPDDDQVKTMLNTIEPFIFRSLIHPVRVTNLKSKVPSRRRKKP